MKIEDPNKIIESELAERAENESTLTSDESKEMEGLEILTEMNQRRGKSLGEFQVSRLDELRKKGGKQGSPEFREAIAGLSTLENMERIKKGEEIKTINTEGLSEETKGRLEKGEEGIQILAKMKKKKVKEGVAPQKSKSEEHESNLEKCSKCGKESPSGSNFCEDCGNNLAEQRKYEQLEESMEI